MIQAMQNGKEEPADRRPLWAHLAPFLFWVGIMSLPISPPAWRYALQSAAGAACLVWFRPWRYYAPPRIGALPLAFVVGLAVCAVWVLPESPWMLRFPYAHDLYLKYGVRPIGVIAGAEAVSPYAPEIAGWGLALIRLAGSAAVIAVAEEFFWRGFLSRRLVAGSFLAVDPRTVRGSAFVLTALAFGLEHDRWLVGMIAGAAYGGLYARTRDIWAPVVAHMVTNFLLGLYVLSMGAYGFW